MDSDTRLCPSCGMQAAPEDAFCTLCGAKLGNAPSAGTEQPQQVYSPEQQPQGYNAPQTSYNTQPYGNMPQQPPAGYTAPPNGYSAPGYSAPQQNFGTPAPVVTAPPQPAKPRRNPAIIVIVLLVGVLALAAVFFAARMNNNGPKQEYNELLEEITGYSSAYDVASYYKRLDAFQTENPKLVDNDLSGFVALCREFENEADSEQRYTNMLESLEIYKASDVSRVASCARRVSGSVQEEYDYFLLYEEGVSTDFDILNFDAALQWNGEFVPYDDGSQQGFAFGLTNTSDKQIVGFEIWAFLYDEDGEPIYDSYSANWEWVEYHAEIEPGEAMSAEEVGYHQVNGFDGDIAFGYIFVNYVEYEDGTYEGMTDFLGYTDTEIWYSILLVNEYADAWAANNS